MRYRALYNLGLVDLLAAEADSAKQQELLNEAADRLREALRLQPSSARAKWNLELGRDNPNDAAWGDTRWDHFVDGSGRNTMRLTFAKESDDRIREGVARLAKVV